MPGRDEIAAAIAEVYPVTTQRGRLAAADRVLALLDRAPDTAPAGAADELRARIEALSKSDGDCMHLWWKASGDDWAVPNWLPGKFLVAVLADLRAALAAPPGPTTTDAAEGLDPYWSEHSIGDAMSGYGLAPEATCGVISRSGAMGEPLACAWPRHGSERTHSWATLPTFTVAPASAAASSSPAADAAEGLPASMRRRPGGWADDDGDPAASPDPAAGEAR